MGWWNFYQCVGGGGLLYILLAKTGLVLGEHRKLIYECCHSSLLVSTLCYLNLCANLVNLLWARYGFANEQSLVRNILFTQSEHNISHHVVGQRTPDECHFYNIFIMWQFKSETRRHSFIHLHLYDQTNDMTTTKGRIDGKIIRWPGLRSDTGQMTS